MNRPENSQKSLPALTPAALQILLAVADRPRHGYAIMQEVERFSEGRISVGPTTLYRTIRSLLEQGVLEETEPKESADTDERRRYYRLTSVGRRAAESEAARLASLVELARSRRVLRDSRPIGGVC